MAVPAFASKAPARKNACLSCHTADRKPVGPAFRDVSRNYGGQQDAETQLARSTEAGGAGKWGPVPMPAQPALGEADAKTLAAWPWAGPSRTARG